MIFINLLSLLLSKSDVAIASLLVAFFPLFPHSILDNRVYFQPMRFLWTLAIEEEGAQNAKEQNPQAKLPNTKSPRTKSPEQNPQSVPSHSRSGTNGEMSPTIVLPHCELRQAREDVSWNLGVGYASSLDIDQFDGDLG